jgi:hypothetical protein
VLENLEPAPKITPPPNFRPGVEFDGIEGTATTPGVEGVISWNEFLEQRGYDPNQFELVGTPRTSQWEVQRAGGETAWLTSYRFTFRKKVADLDLPALFTLAKKTKPPKPKQVVSDRVLIIAPADFQVGKTGSRGKTQNLIERVLASYARIEDELKRNKYEHIFIIDAGDIIENVINANDMGQLQSNDLSPMQQVDVAASLMWELIKLATKYAPVTYGSVASNHCQFRVNKQTVGKPGQDDWGIVILQQLRRLSTEVGLNVKFLIPAPEDEGFSFDAFNDGFHIVGCAHGHQASRPNGIPTYWEKQTFGLQWAAPASLLLTAHFHHTIVMELGQAHNGGSKFWVQLTTSDNGSDWFRRTSGLDSQTGITCIELERGVPYQGAIMRF